jgi:hypothetical protein
MVEVIASGICHSQLNQLNQLARTPDGAPGRLLGHDQTRHSFGLSLYLPDGVGPAANASRGLT